LISDEARDAVCIALGAEPSQSAFDDLCRTHSLYLHKKGGLYRKLYDARSSEDERAVVVYEHLWPHPRGVWVRPADQFNEPDRFRRLTPG